MPYLLFEKIFYEYNKKIYICSVFESINFRKKRHNNKIEVNIEGKNPECFLQKVTDYHLQILVGVYCIDIHFAYLMRYVNGHFK